MKIIHWLGSLLIPVVIVTQMPLTFVADRTTIPLSFSPPIEQGSLEIAAAAAGSYLPTSPSLYQINFTSQKPISSLIIGEHSTGQVMATWRPASQVAAPGKYYVITSNGEIFVLIINNGINGGQFFSIVNSYANRFRIRMDYPDKTFEETLSDPPLTLYNCTFEAMESCMPGAIVPDPYQNCNLSISGFIEIIITDSGGSWDKFKKNVVTPLQSAQEWLPSDVWLYLYQKVNKGYYAEVRITTNKCLRLVVEKLQGNPTILSSNGRQLNIYYR